MGRPPQAGHLPRDLRADRVKHTVTYRDREGEHRQVTGKIISDSSRSLWVVTDDNTDLIIEHDRIVDVGDHEG